MRSKDRAWNVSPCYPDNTIIGDKAWFTSVLVSIGSSDKNFARLLKHLVIDI